MSGYSKPYVRLFETQFKLVKLIDSKLSLFKISSMKQPKLWFEDIPMPALLRHARVAYGAAMRRALDDAGYEDIPKNGLYVIGGLAIGEGEFPLSQLITELRISKQSAGQLVDMLVMRGYLARTVDEDDRRKLSVTLTERGRAAAAVQAAAREEIDTAWNARVGHADILRTRQALAALIDIGRQGEGGMEGQ
jgi:DNA-binding MarR family transcriptional regulator